MKRYVQAIDRCQPPAGLQQRLQQHLQAAQPPAEVRRIRPWTLAKKLALAAVLALLLSMSVGAAVLVEWDAIFAARFGEQAAAQPVTESAFQQVDVTAVCDDVTLTIRQALGDNRTIYLILDYQFGADVDRAAVQAAWDGEDTHISVPVVHWYATGAIDWATYRAQAHWSDTDWSDDTAALQYVSRCSPLKDYAFPGGSSGSAESRSYDRQTGTLTYLLRYTTDSTVALTAQPLTLEVLPPVCVAAGVCTPLAAQPAIITFRPQYTARTESGQATTSDGAILRATVSPFVIRVEYETWGSMAYETIDALRAACTLVRQDGTEVPISRLTRGFGGSLSRSERPGGFCSVEAESVFTDIQDPQEIAAVRVGGTFIPLTGD